MNLLLPLLLIIPVAGAIAVALMPARLARAGALAASLATAAVTVAAVFAFFADDAAGTWRLNTEVRWLTLESIRFTFQLGADAISLWLVVLTAFLMPLAIAASFDSIKD